MADTTLETLEPIVEFDAFSYAFTLTALFDDGSVRPPLLAELSAAELSISLNEDGNFLKHWDFTGTTWVEGATELKNVDVKNVAGRGSYNETTGRFTLWIHSGDNPCVATDTAVGSEETHYLVVAFRYNTGSFTDEIKRRARLKVRNVGKVPRVP